MKQFDIPVFYRSKFITKIKENRNLNDPRKKDFTPAVINFGPVRFLLPRHFGFCYGVENAIEISYGIVEQNPGRRIYLLSEMIHNPGVNEELQSRGVRFITDAQGNQLTDWNELSGDDIVIIPAFGTTIEIQNKLNELGIKTYKYNTTCPFVERVWNRSFKLGEDKYTVIIHGKHYHEETRATFSHTVRNAPAVIVRNIDETKFLGDVILGERSENDFYSFFKDKFSNGFNPAEDLAKIGVVNQTTMLASETQAIADYLKFVMIKKYGVGALKKHFADTRDTLCYATYDNQEATHGLLQKNADLAIVIGGYNSSNTGHIVELCEDKFKTFFISSAGKIISNKKISHFDIHTKKEIVTENFIPDKTPVDIIITSGASCPDSVVEQVIQKILSFYKSSKSFEEVLQELIAGNG